MKISLLDYGLVDEGKTSAEAVRETLELAQLADELGFHRFWVSEHHNVPALSISAPEVVIPYIASHTKNIHIGSGGIMGLHYSPYKVAEIMSTLEGLFPGRVDIGLGNSPGTPLVGRNLQSLYSKEQYALWLEKLQHYLNEARHKGVVVPEVATVPEQFLLGMGGQSIESAATLGLSFVYGVFPYIPQDPVELAKSLSKKYRSTFKSGPHSKPSNFVLAVFVVIADTSEEAEEMAKPLDLWMLGKQDFSEFHTFPTRKDVETYELTQRDREKIASNRSRLIVGNPREVYEQMETLRDVQFNMDDELEAEDEILSLEASKTVMSIVTPLAGKVVARNLAATEDPKLLNSEKPEEHWLVTLTNVDEAAFLALEDE